MLNLYNEIHQCTSIYLNILYKIKKGKNIIFIKLILDNKNDKIEVINKNSIWKNHHQK